MSNIFLLKVNYLEKIKIGIVEKRKGFEKLFVFQSWHLPSKISMSLVEVFSSQMTLLRLPSSFSTNADKSCLPPMDFIAQMSSLTAESCRFLASHKSKMWDVGDDLAAK